MKFLIVFIFIYVAIHVYFYLIQDSKIFRPRYIQKRNFELPKDAKEVTLEVSKDVKLWGIYKKSKTNTDRIIIYFGGNSDDATEFLLHVKSIEDFDMVAFNYRGFVKSGGKPSEKALFEDALRIYDKFAKGKKTVVIGRSLGTGVASYLVSKREAKGLILITPYDSIENLSKRNYPYLFVSLILRHKFESLKYLKTVKIPVAIIEVVGDKTIPQRSLKNLKKEIKNLILHVKLSGTTHGDVLKYTDFDEIIKDAIKRLKIGKF